MKLFILFLIIVAFALFILAIINTIRLKKMEKLEKAKHTPRLSELHGKEFGKYQQRLAVLIRHQRHIASQPGSTPGQKKYLAKRHRLEEQLHSYINHVINVMLDTEEPGIICIPKMPPATSRDGNKYRNHSLTLWQRGYIRKRLLLKCQLRGIEVQEVYGKQ